MSNQVTVLPGHSLVADQWPQEKIDLLKRTICKGATNDELEMFLSICKRTQLDPFARQIYAIKRWDNSLGREVMQTQTSIDGQRLVAERTGKYLGQEGPLWCGEDGVWKEIWVSSKPPVAAKVIVYKKGSEKGFPAVAHWHEYAQFKKDKTLTKMWSERGAGQLGKCAESLALRKGFPQELSGLYTKEEFPPPEDHKEVEISSVKVPDGTMAVVTAGTSYQPSFAATPEIVPSQANPPNAKPWEKAAPTEKPSGWAQAATSAFGSVVDHGPTQDQITRLYTIATANGFTHEQVHQEIGQRYNIDTTKKLSRVQYDEICNFMEGLSDASEPKWEEYVVKEGSLKGTVLKHRPDAFWLTYKKSLEAQITDPHFPVAHMTAARELLEALEGYFAEKT